MFKFKKNFLVGLTATLMSISLFSSTASNIAQTTGKIGLMGRNSKRCQWVWRELQC